MCSTGVLHALWWTPKGKEGAGSRTRRRADWRAAAKLKQAARVARRVREGRLREEVARLRAENRVLTARLEASRNSRLAGPAVTSRGTQTPGRGGRQVRWGLIAAGATLGVAAIGFGAPISAVCLALLTPVVERALA